MAQIKPLYLTIESKRQVRDAFNKPFPGIVLKDFLTPETYKELEKQVVRSAYAKANIPDKLCYGRAPLSHKVLEFFHSDEFLTYLTEALGEEVLQLRSGSNYRFGWKDYTLIHDEMVLEAGVDIILDFTSEWDSHVGGQIVYVPEEGGQMEISPSPNTLILVRRPEGMQRYIRYVNHHAGEQKRYFVLASL